MNSTRRLAVATLSIAAACGTVEPVHALEPATYRSVGEFGVLTLEVRADGTFALAGTPGVECVVWMPGTWRALRSEGGRSVARFEQIPGVLAMLGPTFDVAFADGAATVVDSPSPVRFARTR